MRAPRARAALRGQGPARRPPARRRPRRQQDPPPPVRAGHAGRLPRRAVGRADPAARPRQRGRHARVPGGRLRRAQADADRLSPRPPRRPRPAARRAEPEAAHPAPPPAGAPRRRAARRRADRVRRPRRAADQAARAPPAEGHAAARPPPARRLRRGHRRRRPVPRRIPLHHRRGEPRPHRARGAEALLPRPARRRAVRRRADGPQLARASRHALGLPRRHGAPDVGRDPPRRGPRPADGHRARLPLGRLPGRLRRLPLDLRARPARPARALQRHQRADGDVAPLAPAQGAGRARAGVDRARVRLPAGRRGPSRRTTACAGERTCSAGTSRRTGTRCASCAPGSTRRARRRLRAASCRDRAGPRSRSWRPPSGRC